MLDPVAEVDGDRADAPSFADDDRPVLDVVLGPGDLYFGDRTSRIRTLLGSCVALTLWHPRARIGGMCHYVVPTRRGQGTPHELSGHYADEALEILLREIRAASTSPQDYQVKMFGGGSQFVDPTMNVATKNVEAGLELLKTHHLSLTSMHFGGTGHRQVILDVLTGDVWVRHVALANL
jgi:chemotaxis protein CheD